MKSPNNPTRSSNLALVSIIARCNPSLNQRTGPTTVKEVVTAVVFRLYVWQVAINVLRSRMLRCYDPVVIGKLWELDPRFAKVFCEMHLHRRLRFESQGELALTA